MYRFSARRCPPRSRSGGAKAGSSSAMHVCAGLCRARTGQTETRGRGREGGEEKGREERERMATVMNLMNEMKAGAGGASSSMMKREENTSHDAELASNAMPWVEKYRPKTVEEVSSQEEVVRTLQRAMQTRNVRTNPVDISDIYI